MNPDGTIAGAHGINLTDSSGRLIPVSLSLSLPISSFANSMSTSTSDDSIATSEAAAAASAVHEIFSSQQSESGIDVEMNSGPVITEQIDNSGVIARPDCVGWYQLLYLLFNCYISYIIVMVKWNVLGLLGHSREI